MTTPKAAVEPARATWREWAGLVALMVPVFMVSTDATVLFLAAPAIAADLQPTGGQVLWILHIGDFLAVSFVLTMGRLGDRIGRRRLLFVGVSLYGLASLAAAFSTSSEALILMRALLGIAAATIMPSGMALLRGMFADPKQFSVAIALFLSAFSGGMAVGPVMGGFLLEFFWWGSVFLVNVPAALMLLACAWLLPAFKGARAVKLDTVSVALSLGIVALVVFGLQEFADKGFAWIYAASVAWGSVFGVVFVRRQSRIADPLLDLSLFRAPAFGLSLVAVLLIIFANGGTDMLFAQHLQTVFDLSPARAGLILIVPAMFSIVGTVLAPALTRWMRPAFAMSVSLFVATSGATTVALALFGPSGGTDTLVLSVIGVSALSLGVGPTLAIGTNLIVTSAPLHHTGSATAMQDISSTLGNALGLAFLGSFALVLYRSGLSDSMPADVPSEDAAAAQESIGAAVAVAEQLEGAVSEQLVEAAREAFTVGTQSTYGVAALIFAALTVTVLWKLRHVPIEPEEGKSEGGTEDTTAREG